mmetsp:Transcript_8101/g.15944  ORF Transcript_8101/g.15944 Transcript_8101/m.15944 type:complete len:371 (+) Transcript_8101:54-1166(+)
MELGVTSSKDFPLVNTHSQEGEVPITSEYGEVSGRVSSIRARGTEKGKLLLSSSDKAVFAQSVRARDIVAERIAEIMEEVRGNPALVRKYELLLLDDAKTEWMHTGNSILSGYEMERLCVRLKEALKTLPKYKPMAIVKEPHKPQFEVGPRNEGGMLSTETHWLIKETKEQRLDTLEAEANRLIKGKGEMPTFTFKAKSLFQQSGRNLVQTPPKKPPKPPTQKYQPPASETSIKPFVTKFFVPDCRTMKANVAKDMSLGTEPSVKITTFRDEITPQELGKEEFVLSFKVQHEEVSPLEQRKTKVEEDAEKKAAAMRLAEAELKLRTCLNGRERGEFNPIVMPAHRRLQLGKREPHYLLDRELYKGCFDIE